MSKSRSKQQRKQSAPARRPSSGSAGQRRQVKRAQFEAPRRSRLAPVLAIVAVVVLAAAAGVFFMSHKTATAATATTAASAGGDVKVALAQVNDGKAHFFTYDAGGTTVRYFVLSDKKGVVRAALDACEVCYPQHKGYRQVGDSMQCNNCGKTFRSDLINVITGGCNPIPLKRSVSGSNLTITASSLQAGAQYFQ